MKPTNESCMPGSCEYWMVSAAAGKLGSQASTLGVRHIKDGTLRLQFNREVAYYAKSIVNDVSQGKKSPEQGLQDLKDEQSSLLSQSFEIAQKGVGAIAGAFQIATGAGICYGSAGTLCLVAGVPMMAHGANNLYENGRNLLESRSDTQGPVRKVYQEGAKLLGGGALEGDMAYGTADLGLSAYGVGRMVLKPDAWRLFRYINTDYIRSYKAMGSSALIFEGVSDSVTGRSMYLEYKGNDK
ncbi:DUF4225 domain-containing protein [Pseudomonas mucidolens]|uniref:DUF4225 domain-containing protein n=1 Tax=Pseudomonas mucidolens TaxID=46679 RepID=A0A1H2NCE2_9PSED|nr:DUF4225 domain-containing protein [Pseudomonas mucidolens]SDV02841.1 Protein of unknown function [Pseudomonas mucidolens]SQH32261.1 Uncharacterised protein [Pseudomonas mucidolens]